MMTKFVSTAACGFFLLGFQAVATATEDSLTTSVYSSVSNGYVRAKMPDGTFKRETYAISNVGKYSPRMIKDQSIDGVKFPAIAGLVAEHLAKQNYFLAQDAKSVDLLLAISWGTTIPYNDGVYRVGMDGVFAAMNQLALAQGAASTPGQASDSNSAVTEAAKEALDGELIRLQMFNAMRQKANEHNAQLLGYVREINDRNNASQFAGAGDYFHDLLSDIEEERYYVIVSAYDFRSMTQGKKPTLLWATRVSIRAQGNRFDERLQVMLANASRQFGKNSGRLMRQYQLSPRVDLKELKFLGIVQDSTAQTQAGGGK